MIPRKLADGLWVIDGDPLSFLSFPYEIRCTIIDIGGGELLIHSPVQVSAATQLESLPGQLKYIVIVNHGPIVATGAQAFLQNAFQWAL